jgi:hypothetical protein
MHSTASVSDRHERQSQTFWNRSVSVSGRNVTKQLWVAYLRVVVKSAGEDGTAVASGGPGVCEDGNIALVS